jgi:hypothetical protein
MSHSPDMMDNDFTKLTYNMRLIRDHRNTSNPKFARRSKISGRHQQEMVLGKRDVSAAASRQPPMVPRGNSAFATTNGDNLHHDT